MTDKPTSEPRPPIYPAEWMDDPSCSFTLTWSPYPSEPASVPVRQNPTAVIQSAIEERQEPRSHKREHQNGDQSWQATKASRRHSAENSHDPKA